MWAGGPLLVGLVLGRLRRSLRPRLAEEPAHDLEVGAAGATLHLGLPFSGRDKWNAADIWGKDNLVFTVEVVNADDLQGRKLAAAFTFKDAERLEQAPQPGLRTTAAGFRR